MNRATTRRHCRGGTIRHSTSTAAVPAGPPATSAIDPGLSPGPTDRHPWLRRIILTTLLATVCLSQAGCGNLIVTGLLVWLTIERWDEIKEEPPAEWVSSTKERRFDEPSKQPRNTLVGDG